ncbi:DUF1772 domain-containing protein [Flavobacterium magnum]|uniref:DUF1772 domain-containing protein n=1 Tax=Flavobacterium magnum TaxID=2162713 RepID=A0A2S0RCN3_9FLAO|nr:anthrone oxygenase family protein [Flavobacterium magnum]AWA29446.1 DUF1772 domain-containing protein [Flavobacterium magnum]
MNLPNLSLWLALLCTALISGLYYAYSCSVNPGLATLRDGEYLGAMQAINRAILNGLFFLSFFGSLIMLSVTSVWHYNTPRFAWLLAATAVYAIGSFAVTVIGNVPLNEALDGFDVHSASAGELREMRLRFENPWSVYHRIRSVATCISLALIATAAVLVTEDSQTVN